MILCSAMNGLMADQPSSSIETPTTSSPRLFNCCWNSTNQGISKAQGPHQVAQKFSKTTFPRKSLNFTDFPFASFKVKSGAILRSLTVFAEAAPLGLPEHPENKSVSETAKTAE